MIKVLVLGDIIIDRYLYGTASRLSPEAPVPIVTYQHEVETVGGAGLVYNNLKNLGVDVTLLDYFPQKSIKTRVICDGHYVTRIDNDHIVNGNEFLTYVLSMDFDEYTYVILSDYDKGTLDESLEIIKHINSFGCRVIVDPKGPADGFAGAWLVKPNAKEFSQYNFLDWRDNIIVTDSFKNVIANIDDVVYDIPVAPIAVNDVTGAGDCFLAAFVYALTRNKDYQAALEMAVKGSSESVKHAGTYILENKDLEDRIVFTNGVFDIMHTGHFELFQEAKSRGEKLIVGINSDASVKRLKGDSRPINNVKKRIAQLEILPWIDEVIVFDEDTPYELIKKLQPNLIVKGGDYTVEQVVGNDLAPVHIVNTVESYSTTSIIEASK
jgi:D-beta-D-heptose 7-phosphate kinase/D-beta-D-heptose 1-phosphate adenosyltransferase